MITDGLNTLLADSVSHGGARAWDYDWMLFNRQFTATGATATLAFETTIGSTNGGIFLDKVSVDLVPTSVPEPATLALVGLGVVGLGFSRRKQ